MSRIGKKPVPVPKGVTVLLADRTITVEGPKGKLSWEFRPEVIVTFDETTRIITVARIDDERLSRALHGLSRAMIVNMVVGVTDGYEKTIGNHWRGLLGCRFGQSPATTRGFRQRTASANSRGYQGLRAGSTAYCHPRHRQTIGGPFLPPPSAQNANPSPTKARVFATSASRSAANKARLWSSNIEPRPLVVNTQPRSLIAKLKNHETRKTNRHAAKTAWDARAQSPQTRYHTSPFVHFPQPQKFLRTDHRRCRRTHLSLRQHHGNIFERAVEIRRQQNRRGLGRKRDCQTCHRGRYQGSRLSTVANTKYHGRVAALADAAREAGLVF